ncbi:MAG: hypothetical protein KBF71_08200 [Alphaproteobacteria bacterium]|nr:hypothetical protein [Alphaproteobacteria bacterium]
MDKGLILDQFGEIYIHFVRDKVMRDFLKTQAGKIKSKTGISLYEKLSKLDPEVLLTMNEVVLDTLDTTIDYVLWMIEQHEEYDLIRYTDDEKNYVSLRDISDGLSGELYTEEGWIEKFSSYEPSYK